MEQKKFSLSISNINFSNKISIIKAIRTLTNFRLVDAKEASERIGVSIYTISPVFYNTFPQTADIEMENIFQIFRSEGITVGEPIYRLLEELRKIGAQALVQGEDEFANEILQLVLAEKLRRKF